MHEAPSAGIDDEPGGARVRAQIMATMDGKLHQLQAELTERMRHLPVGVAVAHGRLADGELEVRGGRLPCVRCNR